MSNLSARVPVFRTLRVTLVLCLSILALSVVLGCSERATEYPSPNLSPDDALQVAANYLGQQEVPASDYDVVLVGFNYIDRTWRISYRAKSGILHDQYWLKISDEGANEVSLLPL